MHLYYKDTYTHVHTHTRARATIFTLRPWTGLSKECYLQETSEFRMVKSKKERKTRCLLS